MTRTTRRSAASRFGVLVAIRLAVAALLTTALPLMTPGASASALALPPFSTSTHSVSAADLPSSYRSGCPVAPAQLRLLRLSHVGFDGRAHQGELVVHADSLERVLRIFHRLYENGFPIQRMQRVDVFGGSDDRSMEANNTSAFNCRRVAGSTSWSEHAYGRAVDLNPVQNPYVSGGTVSPPAGRAYLNRSDVRIGMVVSGDRVVRAFADHGWSWGGHWVNSKDYQHFASGNDGRLPPPAPAPLPRCSTPLPAPPASPVVPAPAIARYNSFHFRPALSPGPAAGCVTYGLAFGDVPLSGDWDGNGTRTIGIFRSGAWHLRNSNSQGGADISLSFGRAGDFPVVGDWDGDGVDTIGVMRSGTWFLRNTNSTGASNIDFKYGRELDRAITGDWDGDGTTTVGVVRSSTWYLTNQHDTHTSDIATKYGRATDEPVIADWNDNGTETIGVFRDGTWYLSNDNRSSTSHIDFGFGRTGDSPIAWQ